MEMIPAMEQSLKCEDNRQDDSAARLIHTEKNIHRVNHTTNVAQTPTAPLTFLKRCRGHPFPFAF
jgi:hypothetical protein